MPNPPFRFAQEVKLAMLTRDPSMFLSKNRREWDQSIAQMFSVPDRRQFFNMLKKMTKYNASKEAIFANSITVNGLVVTEAPVISQIVLKEVLLHNPGRAGPDPTPIPALQPGELFNASKLLSAGKGLGLDL